jgi:hypothetical protein
MIGLLLDGVTEGIVDGVIEGLVDGGNERLADGLTDGQMVVVKKSLVEGFTEGEAGMKSNESQSIQH